MSEAGLLLAIINGTMDTAKKSGPKLLTHCPLSQTPDGSSCCQGWRNQSVGLERNYIFTQGTYTR